MPQGEVECRDRDEAFAKILEAARRGECNYCESTDERGVFIIEAEPWNRHCLTYPAVRQLRLSTDSERLGASVFRYIWLYARKGYRHNRTEWVRQIPNAGEMKEFGISVSEFSKDNPVRHSLKARGKTRPRTNRAEGWIAQG